jgi:hypothetical protein
MDQGHEDPDRFRAEPGEFDPERHRRRTRALAALAIGALAAGVVWVVRTAVDSARNPCQRVRDYACGREPGSARCQSYTDLLRDSIEEQSPAVRGEIRDQCVTRIKRLKKDDGIDVP